MAWVIVWVGLGLALGLWIAATQGRTAATEYFAAYLLEKSLSVDNMFVFVVIFSELHIPTEYQRRVLLFGVVGALVFRALMIGAGADKTRRGLRGRVELGKAGGGVSFGYRIVRRFENGVVLTGEREVVPEEAEIGRTNSRPSSRRPTNRRRSCTRAWPTSTAARSRNSPRRSSARTRAWKPRRCSVG